jgi:hypothetical protein
MKMRQFVSGSAVVIAGWLVVTFVHEVPVQRYRKSGPEAAARASGGTKLGAVAQRAADRGAWRVSGSP